MSNLDIIADQHDQDASFSNGKGGCRLCHPCHLPGCLIIRSGLIPEAISAHRILLGPQSTLLFLVYFDQPMDIAPCQAGTGYSSIALRAEAHQTPSRPFDPVDLLVQL